MTILNFGSLNLDYVYKVDSIVRPGETVTAKSAEVFFGGKGLNQSIALSRAGHKHVLHAGAVGEDGLGLKRLLEENKVNTQFVQTLATQTGSALIQVEDSGQNSIVVAGGANQQLTTAFIDTVLNTFDKGDLLLLQNEVNHLADIIEIASNKELFIILNPSPANETLLKTDLSHISLFILNEHEGHALTKQTEPEKIIASMRQQYPTAKIVLTLGSQGSIYADQSNFIFQEAVKTVPVDTTAAGDTFTGFFLAAYAQDKKMSECLKIASVAASLAIQKDGASSSIPTWDEVKKKIIEKGSYG